MTALGMLYQKQGRYDDAEPLLVEALETKRQVLGDEHVETALSMHVLACIYRDTGRHREAQTLFEEVQGILETRLGSHHPHYAENLEQHAQLLRIMGEHEQAEHMGVRARDIRKESGAHLVPASR